MQKTLLLAIFPVFATAIAQSATPVAQTVTEASIIRYLKDGKLLQSFTMQPDLKVNSSANVARTYTMTTLPRDNNNDNPVFKLTMTPKTNAKFVNKIVLVGTIGISENKPSFGYNFGAILGVTSVGCLGLDQKNLELFSNWLDETFSSVQDMDSNEEKSFSKTFGSMKSGVKITLSTSVATFSAVLERNLGQPNKNDWPKFCLAIQK